MSHISNTSLTYIHFKFSIKNPTHFFNLFTEILICERELLYLFSDEHGITVFTDDICQRTGLVMDLNFIREIEENHEENLKKLKQPIFIKSNLFTMDKLRTSICAK